MRSRMGSRVRLGVAAVAAAGVLAASACSLGVEADDKPGTARVRVEGTAPDRLVLVVSTDFYEEYDPMTGGFLPVLGDSNTRFITPPFDETLDLGNAGRVYVELRNPSAAEAAIRFRVDLDNGRSYDRTDRLSGDRPLIYYYVYTNLS